MEKDLLIVWYDNEIVCITEKNNRAAVENALATAGYPYVYKGETE